MEGGRGEGNIHSFCIVDVLHGCDIIEDVTDREIIIYQTHKL